MKEKIKNKLWLFSSSFPPLANFALLHAFHIYVQPNIIVFACILTQFLLSRIFSPSWKEIKEIKMEYIHILELK